jgi:hypothetical protein
MWISLLVVLPLLFSLLFSCGMKQEVDLEVDGSGTVQFRFELEQFFLDTLLDMASLENDNEAVKEGRIFDLEEIEKEFAKKPEVVLKRIDSPSPRVLEGEFVFTDLEKVFRSEKELTAAGVISIQRSNGQNTIRVHLDRANFDQVAAFLPLQENPLFEVLGPEENEDTTEEEYLEMMEFMLGEAGPPAIKDSFIELKVNVRGRVLSQTGGEIVEQGVVFRIPLIRVLLLDQPLDYSVVFE